MFAQAASFLAEVVIGLFSLALLLRFFLQLVRAPHRNPVSQFVAALTDFLVKPARRFIPGLWGLDLATLVLAWLCEVVLLVVLLAIRGVEPGALGGTAFAGIFVLGLIRLLKTSVYIVMVAVIVQAIMSWFGTYSPLSPILNALTQPLLGPLQKRMPLVGNVDLSPLVLIVVLQLILMIPIAWLEMTVTRLF
jgi:YggT family protein